MNQAGSENKCSKRVSNECILNNYNFDDVSTDQNSICENCKQKGWSVCDKHSCHVGTVSDSENVVEVAEVSHQQQQTGTNNLCHQSLLQKAWVYLQSVITTRVCGCARFNPKPPPTPCVESPSRSSISFLSSISSPSRPASPSRLSSPKSYLSCMTSCNRSKSRPRCSSVCCDARPPSSKAKRTKPKPKAKTSCLDFLSPCPYSRPPCPNAESPSAQSSCPSLQQPCPHAKPPSPQATPPTPNPIQPCPYAIPPCPHSKSVCPNAECPKAKPSCPSLQPHCPKAKSSNKNIKQPSLTEKGVCPYAKPPCSNAECPNSKPSCPNDIPRCPYAKQPCKYARPLCPYPECPNAIPSCPSLQPTCPKHKPSKTKIQKRSNSKTNLYSFSDDSLSSMCKESLVELAKVYFQKITSDHKIGCPRCSKLKQLTCSANSGGMTSYLRSVFHQAWGFFGSSVKKTGRPQSNCSNTSVTLRISESPSNNSRCYCSGSKPKTSKSHSCESVCCHIPESRPKSVSCPVCLTAATSTVPVSCSTCQKSATKCYICEGPTSPAQRSEEVGTHEHKSCDTPCCIHNSEGVQPSHIMSDKSCCSSQTSICPLPNRSRQIKTPQSVEELKASITGVTCFNKSSGTMPGYEIMDFHSTIEYSKPCVQDLKVAKDSICSTDIPPKLDSSLTMEQKYHKFGSRPKECKHSKESLDNCEGTMSPCIDLEEQTCKEEASCPSSGGCAKSDEALLDKDSGSKPREQVHSKEKICKSGRNSETCVDSNHPDRKVCNAPEKDVNGKDPNNYRYYY